MIYFFHQRDHRAKAGLPMENTLAWQKSTESRNGKVTIACCLLRFSSADLVMLCYVCASRFIIRIRAED